MWNLRKTLWDHLAEISGKFDENFYDNWQQLLRDVKKFLMEISLRFNEIVCEIWQKLSYDIRKISAMCDQSFCEVWQ